MTITEAEKRDYEAYFSNHVVVSAGVDGHAWAMSFVSQLVQHASDTSYLQRYAGSCRVAGMRPEDYAATTVRLDASCTVLTAIHFLGRSVGFPFIDVSAQTGALPRPLPVATLAHTFRGFHPRSIRIWRFGSDAAPEGIQDDLVVVGGVLRTLQTAPDLPGLSHIRLEADPTVAFYDEYCQMYGSPQPAHRSPTLELRTSLEQCAQTQGLFRVMIDNRSAGVIAARPDSYRSWRGWHVVEEVLHPDYRGRHLAAAMQQAFLRRLEPEREPFLFGTIAAANMPSLRTALRVGRQVLEIGGFVPLDVDTPQDSHEA